VFNPWLGPDQFSARLGADLLLAPRENTSWTRPFLEDWECCIGQNDFSCLLSPAMFDDFCLADTVACANYVDRTIYHLDGPGAVQHVPRLLTVDRLDCIQWIQGAGQPLPSNWLDLLKRIQSSGKSVQLYYAGAHGGTADFRREIEILCGALDKNRLFFVIEARSTPEADDLVRLASSTCVS
jgi:hypothetical protein